MPHCEIPSAVTHESHSDISPSTTAPPGISSGSSPSLSCGDGVIGDRGQDSYTTMQGIGISVVGEKVHVQLLPALRLGFLAEGLHVRGKTQHVVLVT